MLAMNIIKNKLHLFLVFLLFCTPVFSSSKEEASQVVIGAIDQINFMLDSGLPLEQVHSGIEDMFRTFADTNYIGKVSLGRPWLNLSEAERIAYIMVFQGYLSRKYAIHFPKFIGGNYEIIQVNSSNDNQNFEVVTQMYLNRRAPFPVYWYLKNIDGKPRIQNMVVDDLNLLALEKKIVGVLWEKSRGNISTLIGTVANR